MVANGYVYPENEQRLYAFHSGRVAEVFVYDGHHVEAGAPLVRLEQESFDQEILELHQTRMELATRIEDVRSELVQLRLDPALSDLLTANERIRYLRRILELRQEIQDRMHDLERREAVSRMELDREKISFLEAEAELIEREHLSDLLSGGYFEKREGELQTRLRNLQEEETALNNRIELIRSFRDALTLKAPVDGLVTYSRTRHIGQKITAGDLLMKIAPSGSGFRVRAFPGERNVDLIVSGLPVRISSPVFDAPLEGYSYGEVLFRSPEPSASRTAPDGNPLYEAIIRVDSSPYPLVLGSNVEVEFILGHRSILEMFLRRAPGRRELPTVGVGHTESRGDLP